MKRLKLLPLVAIALVGCLDGTGPRRPGGPNAEISDGAHGTTHKFFFFLPPMVPNPTLTGTFPTGTFNRFLSPVVQICELAGASCGSTPVVIATFTTTTGPGSETVRLTGEQYEVNWHTNEFTLNPIIDYRIRVLVEGVELGFADVNVGSTGKELRNVNTNEEIPLVDGRTLPIKFRIEFGAVDYCPNSADACARATVGTDGGQLVATDDDGVPLAFADFPPGWTSVPREVVIAQIVRGCGVEGGEVCGPGEGPLKGAPAGVRQYPLFFEYTTDPPSSPETPFNLPVRIGVCNVGAGDDSEGFEFHPPHRETTFLALGATEDHGFTILDVAPTGDLLGACMNVEPIPGGGIDEIGLNRLDGWQGLLARAGGFAANLLAPRALEAVVLVDGGMGGSTDFFSPVGTVDIGTTELTLISGNGAIGTLDPNNQFTTDGGETFQQAFIITPNLLYSIIPGTNYIGRAADGSGPEIVEGGTPPSTRYRTSFTLPEGFSEAALTIDIHADNVAQIFLNGTQIGEQTPFEEIFPHFQDPAETFSTANPALFQAGSNVLEFVIYNFFGPTGFDYKAMVTFRSH